MISMYDRSLNKLLDRILVLIKWLIPYTVAFILVLVLTGCVESAVSEDIPIIQTKIPSPTAPIAVASLAETSPPEVMQKLRAVLEVHQPQVKILSPQDQEIIPDDAIAIKLQVNDFPLFQDPQWRLGPHLNLILDNQPYTSIYDLHQPLVIPNLSPGTHTLRVFAVYPWNESYKNEGAYAQITFHLFTKTDENNPNPQVPLLTYNSPQDSFGAEPILLDYYLTNAPLHEVAPDNPDDNFSNWRIRITINGESFITDRWRPIYLKGFKTGKNWVKLEFLDNQGKPVKNAFNNTVRIINYQPHGEDTLSQIIRQELTFEQVRGIADQKYAIEPITTPKVPEVVPTPTVVPEVKKPLVPQPKIKDKPTPKPEIPELLPDQLEEFTKVEQPKVEPEIEPKIEPEIERSPEVETSPTESPQPESSLKVEPSLKYHP